MDQALVDFFLNENININTQNFVQNIIVTSVKPSEPLKNLPRIPEDFHWVVSTPGISGYPVGTILNPDIILPERIGYRLPFRLVALPKSLGINAEIC